MQQTSCTQKEPKHGSTAHCRLPNVSNFVQPWHLVSKRLIGAVQCPCMYKGQVKKKKKPTHTRVHVPIEAPRAPPTAAPVAILFTHCWSSNATATINCLIMNLVIYIRKGTNRRTVTLFSGHWIDKFYKKSVYFGKDLPPMIHTSVFISIPYADTLCVLLYSIDWHGPSETMCLIQYYLLN